MTENYFYPDTDERRCDFFITERFYLDDKSCDRLIEIMKKQNLRRRFKAPANMKKEKDC